MNGYLLLLDDVNAMDQHSDTLIVKANRHFDTEFSVYRPLPFTDHTGFTETVEEEIDFVVGCQQAAGGARCDTTAFIRQWGFSELLGKRVVELSGGWRKFLGVALFTNRRTEAKFYIDVASHLADERLRLLFDRLNLGDEKCVVFCEYDSVYLAGLGEGFRLVHDAGDRLESVDGFMGSTSRITQANYEQP
jgi:hypothetical protein